MIFEEQIFFELCFIKRPNFLTGLPLLLEILGSICIVIIYCPVCEVMNFEIIHSFIINPFFYVTKNSRKNFMYLFLTCNKKLFSSFSKGFQLPEIVLNP